MEVNWAFGIGTIVATLLGPILAVQAQKYLERINESRNQKNWIFSTLMATRAARLSADHVRALNMIDLAFNGGRTRRRKPTETDVLETWRDYLDHLTSTVNDANIDRWIEKQNELLIVMLSAMAADLNLRYDRALLRNGAYIPRGHTDLESEQQKLRHLAIEVLSSKRPLAMDITNFPFSEEVANSQINLQTNLSELLSGENHIKVRIEPENNPSPKNSKPSKPE